MAALEAFQTKVATGLASLEAFKENWLSEISALKTAMEKISNFMEIYHDERRAAENVAPPSPNVECDPADAEAAENVQPVESATPPLHATEEIEAVVAQFSRAAERGKKVRRVFGLSKIIFSLIIFFVDRVLMLFF